MNSQDFRNLQEAYLDVYENEQLDEMPYRVFTKNDKGEEVSVGGTYATGKTARTKANKEDEKVGGYRHSVRKVEEETDIFDYVMEYLISEGYAETPEAALAIMGNMSEDWRESIAEDAAYNTLKGFGYPGALVSAGLNNLSGGKIAKPDQPTAKSTLAPKTPTVSSSGGAGGKVTVDKQYPATLNKEKGMKSTGETGTEYFTPNIRGTNITDFDKAQYKNTYTNTYKDIPARQSTKNPQSHLSRTGVPRVYTRTASYGIDD